MYKLLKDMVLPSNIYINDDIIEKQRCTTCCNVLFQEIASVFM